MTKQKERVEFRYYEIPEDEPVLALLGDDWIREYGKHINYLHFHNLMEIGYCHWGTGEVILGQEHIPFSGKSVMIVPPRLPHTTNSDQGTCGIGSGCILISLRLYPTYTGMIPYCRKI